MTSQLRSRIRTFLILTGLFFIVTLFFSTENFFRFLLSPKDYRLSLWQEFLLYTDRWLTWVLCAPVAIWLARRFPVRGRRWLAHLAVLVPSSVALSAVQSSLCVVAYRLWFSSLVGLPPTEGTYLADYWLTGVNQLHINIVTFVVIQIVVWGIDYLRLYREKELAASQLETELAKARLQVLASRVHPHFLFNTLHMISAMVYEDPGKADLMISRLSDLLRATLDQPDTATVPLKTELDVLSLYLDIMKARFGDRLAVSYEIEPDTLAALVPSFSLQPLVENAIKYGIMPRNDGGAVTIAASRNDGRLVVGVSDDGGGLKGDPETLLHNGVGLRNIKSRLFGLYGADGVLRLGNRAEGGARIAFDIPYRTQAD
jgi:two-component system, LytTR family, sensor kinase